MADKLTEPAVLAPPLSDYERESQWTDYDPAPAPEPIPPSPTGFYWITTPAPGFTGPRGPVPDGADRATTFVGGEAVVHENQSISYPMPGRTERVRLIDWLATDLHYTVEPIPEGVPPVPRATLAAMTPAVAQS